MNRRRHAILDQLGRPTRWVLLLAMAWLLSLSGIFHMHELGHPSRFDQGATYSTPGAPVLQSELAEDACAICDWKIHTPYTPAQKAPKHVAVVIRRAHQAETPRAPPVLARAYFDNRAPPRLLS